MLAIRAEIHFDFWRCTSYFCPILPKIRMARSFLVEFPSSIFHRSAFRNSLGVMYLQLRVQFQVHANFNIKFYRCAYLRFDIFTYLAAIIYYASTPDTRLTI
jgi:hypothetical protein